MEANKLEKILEKIADFLECRVESRILLWKFLWLVPTIPFQIIGTFLNEAFGYGKRKRKEKRISQNLVLNTFSILKIIYDSENKLNHEEVLEFAKQIFTENKKTKLQSWSISNIIPVTADFEDDSKILESINNILEYWIQTGIIQYNKEGLYTHKGIPRSTFNSKRKDLKKMYEKYNESIGYIEPINDNPYKTIPCPKCGNTTTAIWNTYCDRETCDTYLGKEQAEQAQRWREQNSKEIEEKKERLNNWKDGVKLS